MPERAKRPCRHAGCDELVENGFCAGHAGTARQPDKWRGTAHSRGYDKAWSRARERALERDNYICVQCYRSGRVTAALDVDHILPISQRPDLRLDPDNLQSLCRSCHVQKTKQEQKRG